MALLAHLCFIIILLLTCYCKTTATSEARDGGRRTEIIKWENGFPGVAWIVQISDLHISSFHPERARSLKRLLGPALAMIRPALVLITGDLTDAKNRKRTVTRQDEAEWIEYHEMIQSVLNNSQMVEHTFFDLRGNHDMYGVPFVGSHLDFYSKYSINAHFNRTNPVQSITLMGQDDKFLFVGIDNSMSIGLRGPSNFFGHPTDKSLFQLDVDLGQWDNFSEQQVPKIVFGHFPLSFTTSTKKQGRMEDILAKHSVSAYICGHLHSKFGKRLYKHHLNSLQGGKEFWEWEIGDWRVSRIIRVLAIDKGSTSFVDIDLSKFEESSQLPIIILPTFPLNSQTMQRYSSVQSVNGHKVQVQQSIRALLFSQRHIDSVVAKIFDFSSGFYELVEELELQLNRNSSSGTLFYESEWDIWKYSSPSPSRFWLQVVATDHLGNKSASLLQPFSVDGKVDTLKWSWMEYLVINVRWEDLYRLLLWGVLFLLFVLLLPPKIFGLFLDKHHLYDKWVVSILNPNCSRVCFSRILSRVPLWILVEGSQNWWLWGSQLFYLIYLLLFPWFSGNVLADDYPTGSMYIWGWTVQLSPFSPWHSRLGVPDVIAITLPFFYLVLLPSVLTIASLVAERAAWEFHANSKFKCKKQDDVSAWCRFQQGGPGDVHKWRGVPSVITYKKRQSCNICQRRFRAGLVFGCLGILGLHLRQCFFLAGAYGAKKLLTSPGFVWPVPLLLAAALSQTANEGILH